MSNDIVDFLKGCLKEFLRSSDKSIRSLAMELGLDYQRLYRLYNDELRNLSYSEAIRLARYLKPLNWEIYLKRCYPAEMHDFISENGSPKAAELIKAFQAIVRTPLATEIFIYSTSEPDASSETISRLYGARGLQILDDLIRNKAVIEDKGSKIFSGLDGCSDFPDEILTTLFHQISDLVDHRERGSLLRFFANGLNDAGMRRAYSMIAETAGAIADLNRDPEFSGKNVFITTLLCGRLTDRNLEP